MKKSTLVRSIAVVGIVGIIMSVLLPALAS